jgi:hypothetical protein
MPLDYNSLLFDSAVVSTGSNDDLFTLASASQSVDNLVIRFTNYTISATTAQVWCQASAGAEADADKVAEVAVGANSYVDVDIHRMVGGGNKAKLTVTAGTATTLSVSLVDGIARTT